MLLQFSSFAIIRSSKPPPFPTSRTSSPEPEATTSAGFSLHRVECE